MQFSRIPYVKIIENKQSRTIASAKNLVLRKKETWRMTNQKFISNTMLWQKSFWKFVQDIFEWNLPWLFLNWRLLMDLCFLGLTLRFSFIELHMFKFFKYHCYWMLVIFIMICLRSSRWYLEDQTEFIDLNGFQRNSNVKSEAIRKESPLSLIFPTCFTQFFMIVYNEGLHIFFKRKT